MNGLTDYDLIDRKCGDVVAMVRYLWQNDPVACCICEKPTQDDFAVPYYCGPVREGRSEGGYRAACATCYEKWCKWNDSFNTQKETAA